MAANTQCFTSLTQLELIRERTLSQQDTNILGALALGIQPATAEAAWAAARQLDRLCPSLANEEDALNYLWEVWHLVLDAARSPDVSDEVHIRLVTILEHLQQCAKGEIDVWGHQQRLWKDLPLFHAEFAEYDNDPSLQGKSSTPRTIRIWQNLNLFAARCFGAGVLRAYAQATDALRLALEDELSPSSQLGIADCRVQIACSWVFHGSKPLLWWAKDNISYTDVPSTDTKNYCMQGPLYDGPATMCFERWHFWISRFEELAKAPSGLGDHTRQLAAAAAQTMNALERRMTNMLSAY